jgi:hypothetical protein
MLYASESIVKTVLSNSTALKKPAPLDVVVTTAPEPKDYDLFRAIFGLQMEGTKTRLLAQFKQA